VDEQLRALGQRIRQLRGEKGWSQEEFAEVCGVHRTYMGHIERGEKNLSFNSMTRVANALNVELSELFMGLGDEETEPRKAGTGHGSKRNPITGGVDRDRLIREVAALERVLAGLKELALTSGTGSEKRLREQKKSK
jgi:transcriptional regulator with XRE-family HTH domain